ncbi:EamA family transporter [Clostridium sp. CS001]|nr:SMR family transporter [Clostridium sp. CS001]MCB2288556.1 EamA family transporter [Clostridium sp. CS001]
MTYLILAIICSSSIALIFKYSEGNEMNRYAVTSTNYFTAFTVSLLMILFKPSIKFYGMNISITSFINEFTKVILKNNGSFSEGASFSWALLLGVIGGVFFFLSFVYYQKSVRENGAALSGTFGKLGILVPMIFSVVIWREIPGLMQWIGIFMALFSILFVNLSSKKDTVNNRSITLTLILLFIFGGMAEFQNKLFQQYALTAYKDVFLFFTFVIAFFLSLYFVIKSKQKIMKKDLLIGFLVGIPNLFSSYFLIMALNSISTSIAFPIYSAGSIIFISLGEVILYKEKLSKKNQFAILVVILALTLINI